MDLWELPGFFVEAEFHSVWRMPTGEFFDVAPKAEVTQRILFLPDYAARYKGVQVNNVRRAVARDSETEEYLAMFDQLFELLNRGECAEQHGEIQLTGAEAAEYDRMVDKMAFMHSRISNRFPLLRPLYSLLVRQRQKNEMVPLDRVPTLRAPRLHRFSHTIGSPLVHHGCKHGT